jgi:predicted RNA-binding protein
VYKTEIDGSRNMVCEGVTGVSVTGETVTLTDLLGQEIEVRGILKNIDLVKNAILIDSLAS